MLSFQIISCHIKSEKFKPKLQEIFVNYWFHFVAEVALILITYCSVQIIYKHAVYPAVYILPSKFSGTHSGYFALISSNIVGLSTVPQQTCVKMNICN